MSAFATLAAVERRLYLDQVATRLGVVPVIVEKDFWVCWILERIFATPALAADVVFKGGTSLFKVFRVITRFSEDVDLSVTPASLGFAEQDLDEAPSSSQRSKRMQKLAGRCEARVRDDFQPVLESEIVSVLGAAPAGAQWLSYAIDPVAATPNLWFEYPSVLPQPGGYVAKRVKLEIGALTRQQPTGAYSIAPLLADALGMAFDDFSSRVVALELVRTFWEKATILHAEFHRPAQKVLRELPHGQAGHLPARASRPASRGARARLRQHATDVSRGAAALRETTGPTGSRGGGTQRPMSAGNFLLRS